MKNPFKPKRRPTVFLSYSRQDKSPAGWIAEQLERSDFLVWRDVDSLSAVSDLTEQISGAIADAALVIVLMSPSYFKSAWAQMETALAVDRKIPLIPVLIEECEVTGYLNYLHRVDLTRSREEGIQALIRAANVLLGMHSA